MNPIFFTPTSARRQASGNLSIIPCTVSLQMRAGWYGEDGNKKGNTNYYLRTNVCLIF